MGRNEAINIILKSIPNLQSFEPTKENLKAVKEAKKNDIGFWIFAEYFMKQKDPIRVANQLNYIGNEKAIASWEIRTPENNDPDVLWIVDVQSKQKGGLTEILNHIINYCKSNNIQYIGLMAYNENVKNMYINKFGFKEVDWFLLKEIPLNQIQETKIKTIRVSEQKLINIITEVVQEYFLNNKGEII